MSDFLDVLALDAKETISSGYYQRFKPTKKVHASLRKAILECKTNAVITEIKTASPSLGKIKENLDPAETAKSMAKAGAVGISVLTEPKHFNGSLNAFLAARGVVNLPILMKDIILSPMQVDAAAQIGANAILLIKALFDRGYSETSLDKMIAYAHAKGLEVLLEVHTKEEFLSAIETSADLVGINNRNLATLKITLNTTHKILQNNNIKNLIVISESGIQSPADLKFLRGSGASAFLIGSSIMLTENIEEKVREFVLA
jgi:indole-3-glycerol phosphate synthase